MFSTQYDIIKDGKVIVTLNTIEEAKTLLKLLGYGYEIKPSRCEEKITIIDRGGRWHI